MDNYVIKAIRTAHCKRGPERCEKCREMDDERICLVEVFSANSGMAQRRVLEFERNGVREWLAFEVVQVFDSREEAEMYALENHIKNVDL